MSIQLLNTLSVEYKPEVDLFMISSTNHCVWLGAKEVIDSKSNLAGQGNSTRPLYYFDSSPWCHFQGKIGMANAVLLSNLPREVWIPLASLCHITDLGNLAVTCPALYHIVIETEVVRNVVIERTTDLANTPRLLFKMPIKSLRVGFPDFHYDGYVSFLKRNFLKSLSPTLEALQLNILDLLPSIYERTSYPTDAISTAHTFLEFGRFFPLLHTLHLRTVSLTATLIPHILERVPPTVTSLFFSVGPEIAPIQGKGLPPSLLHLTMPSSRLILHESLTKLTTLKVSVLDINSGPIIVLPSLTHLSIRTYEATFAFLAPNLIKIECNDCKIPSLLTAAQPWPAKLESIKVQERINMNVISTLPQGLTHFAAQLEQTETSKLMMLNALPSSVRHIHMGGYLGLLLEDVLPQGSRFLPKLETLRGLGSCHSAALSFLPHTLTEFEPAVIVDNSKNVSENEDYFKQHKVLEFVKTHSIPGTFESYIADFLPNVRSLKLMLWQSLRVALPRHLTSLSILPLVELLGQPNTQPAFLDLVIEELPKTLTSFEVHETNATPHAACFESLPPRLSNLSIFTSFDVSQDYRYSLTSSSSLKYLPSSITTLKLWILLPDATFFASLPRHLTSFDFRWTEKIRDEDVAELPRELKFLDLRDAIHLTDQGFRMLPQTLEHLKLNRSRLLTPAIFDYLPEPLEQLYIRRHNGFPRCMSKGNHYGLKVFASRKCCWYEV